MIGIDPSSVAPVAQTIQTALTPAFFLTAIASLLNVLTSRLARIADQVHAVAAACDDALTNARLTALRRRSHLLDVAVILAAFAGVCIAGTVLVLFLGVLRAQETADLLFALFGIAIVCTMGALLAFLLEVLLASRHIRAVVDRKEREVEHET